MAQTLLPQSASIRTIGGPGKEFWVNGVNYATGKGGDAEGGARRIEVSSSAQRDAYFLHALQVFPREPENFQLAGLVRGKGVVGATFPGWTVVVALGEGPIEYDSAARLHLRIGLRPRRYVTAEVNRRRVARVRTSDSGTAVFPFTDRAGATVTVTLR